MNAKVTSILSKLTGKAGMIANAGPAAGMAIGGAAGAATGAVTNDNSGIGALKGGLLGVGVGAGLGWANKNTKTITNLFSGAKNLSMKGFSETKNLVSAGAAGIKAGTKAIANKL